MDYAKKLALAVIAPPLATLCCRGARPCTAPVLLFWLVGLALVVSAAVGMSGETAILGGATWGLAAVWAAMTVERQRLGRDPRLYALNCDETDPLDEVRRAREL